MRIFITISIICSMISASLVYGQSYNHNQSDKQQEAEMIGDLIVQRWHETLDFNSIFKEFFVKNSSLRQKEVYQGFGFSLEPEHLNKIDKQAIERGYITIWNLMYLTFAYNRRSFYLGTELPAAFNEPYRKIRNNFQNISSTKELDEGFSKQLNTILDVLRKKLTPDVLNSIIFKSNVANFSKPQASAEIEHIRDYFKLSKDVKIYIVKREFFYYFLIEEDGKLRVFSVNIIKQEHPN